MENPHLEVERYKLGDREVVVAKGEIDVLSVSKFKGPLFAAADASDDLAIDIREVTYIDSAGLEALIGVYTKMKKRDKAAVILVKQDSQPQAVLRVVRLDSLLTVTSDPALVGMDQSTSA